MNWRPKKKNNQQINKTAFSSFFPYNFRRARTHLKRFTIYLYMYFNVHVGIHIYVRYIDVSMAKIQQPRHATAFFLLLLISFLLHLPHKTIILLNCCRNIIFECVLEWSKKKMSSAKELLFNGCLCVCVVTRLNDFKIILIYEYLWCMRNSLYLITQSFHLSLC